MVIKVISLGTKRIESVGGVKLGTLQLQVQRLISEAKSTLSHSSQGPTNFAVCTQTIPSGYIHEQGITVLILVTSA